MGGKWNSEQNKIFLYVGGHRKISQHVNLVYRIFLRLLNIQGARSYWRGNFTDFPIVVRNLEPPPPVIMFRNHKNVSKNFI